MSRREPGAVLHDPELVAARMVRLATEGRITAVDGTEIEVRADSICTHGDSPGAVEMARARAHRPDRGGHRDRPVRQVGRDVRRERHPRTEPRLLPMGDAALLLETDDIDAVLAVAAVARAARRGRRRRLGRRRRPRARRPHPARRRPPDDRPRRARSGRASRAARGAALAAGSAEQRVVEIAVRYDGPDLEEVARLTGLTPDEVVAAHTGTPWRVGFGGFAPGFAYLVGGDPRLVVARRGEPRTRVPGRIRRSRRRVQRHLPAGVAGRLAAHRHAPTPCCGTPTDNRPRSSSRARPSASSRQTDDPPHRDRRARPADPRAGPRPVRPPRGRGRSRRSRRRRVLSPRGAPRRQRPRRRRARGHLRWPAPQGVRRPARLPHRRTRPG